MSQVGGSIESITLDGRTFSLPSDTEVQRKLGGFENEVLANGDGTARHTKTQTPWSLDGIVVGVADDNGDQEFLKELSARNDFFPVAITLVSGLVYQGSGMITGELQYSTQSATAAFGLMGSGELTKQ